MTILSSPQSHREQGGLSRDANAWLSSTEEAGLCAELLTLAEVEAAALCEMICAQIRQGDVPC